MKPQHGSFKRLNRCACCYGKYKKRANPTGSKAGNSAARRRAKNELQKEIG